MIKYDVITRQTVRVRDCLLEKASTCMISCQDWLNAGLNPFI